MALADRLAEARRVSLEQDEAAHVAAEAWESSPDDISPVVDSEDSIAPIGESIPTPDGVGNVVDAEGKLEKLRGLSDSEPTPDSEAVATNETQIPIDTAVSRAGRILQAGSDWLENGAVKADAVSESLENLKETAKTKVRGIGRAVVNGLKRGGLVTLGVGIIAGKEVGTRTKAGYEATKSGAQTAYEASKNGVNSFGEKVGNGFVAGMKKVEDGLDAADTRLQQAKKDRQTRQFERQTEKDRAESAKNYAKDLKQLESDRAKQEKELAKQDKADAKQANKDIRDFNKILTKKERADARRLRKDEALKRKAARREKWAGRAKAAKEYGTSVAEGFKETKEVAGKYSKEQAIKIGRAVTDTLERAEQSGQAAIDTWKNYPDR